MTKCLVESDAACADTSTGQLRRCEDELFQHLIAHRGYVHVIYRYLLLRTRG